MKKISFLKINELYPYYIDIFDKKISDKLNYTEMYKKLADDNFGYIDVWTKTLEKTNYFQVNEIVSNYELLQRKWAKERGIKIDEKKWFIQILFSQIEFYKPDVILINGFNIFNHSDINSIKKSNSNLKLIIGNDGIGLKNLKFFEPYDIVLSCMSDTSDFYINNTGNKLKGYYLKLGFDENILKKIKLNREKYDFTFSGSIFRGDSIHNHNKRYEDIVTLLYSDLPFKVFSNGISKFNTLTIHQFKRLINLNFKDFYKKIKVSNSIFPAVFGMEMFQLLSDSKITFNSHIDSTFGTSANMRLYEATGVGACLVTEFSENINDLFVPDEEIIVYKSIPECIDKVSNLLRDDNLRKKIAINGQKKTLINHSYDKNVYNFGVFLYELLNNVSSK